MFIISRSEFNQRLSTLSEQERWQLIQGISVEAVEILAKILPDDEMIIELLEFKRLSAQT